MTKPAAMPTDSQSLKKALHERIERLRDRELSLLNRVALHLEAEELAHDLDLAFDEDRHAGRLTPERLEQLIAEVRARHGYVP